MRVSLVLHGENAGSYWPTQSWLCHQVTPILPRLLGRDIFLLERGRGGGLTFWLGSALLTMGRSWVLETAVNTCSLPCPSQKLCTQSPSPSLINLINIFSGSVNKKLNTPASHVYWVSCSSSHGVKTRKQPSVALIRSLNYPDRLIAHCVIF